MRLISFFMLVLCLQVAAKTEGQTVSLSAKNSKIIEVLKAIQTQTGYSIIAGQKELDKVGQVSISVKDMPLADALKLALKGSGIDFIIQGRTITLVESKTPLPGNAAEPEVVVMQITGKVITSAGVPLSNVSVINLTTKKGTVTTADGSYKIEALQGEILLFTYVGYKQQQVKVGRSATVNVEMEMVGTAMEEYVVTGYQTVNKRDMVGSSATVKAKDIFNPASTTIDEMLQGQIAGVMVTNSGSRAGNTPTVEIRGTSTFLGNKSPLWVVDGIIQPDPLKLEGNASLMSELRNIIGNQVSWLNPLDIESITVLKDASATAIYGSKASNGVIVITTRKIARDRTSVNYNGYVSMTDRPDYSRFNVMNSQERILTSEEALNWGTPYTFVPLKQMNTFEGIHRMYLEGNISLETYLAQRKKLESANTDWLDILTRNAVSQTHNVSVSGGTFKNSYRFSLGYNNEQGQETGNDNKRYTANLVINSRLSDKITLNTYLNGTMTQTNSFAPSVNPMTYALSTSRAIPAYEDDGSLLFYNTRASYFLNTNREAYGFNLLNERNNSGTSAKNTQINAAIDFQWKLTPWLTYQLRGGVSVSNLTGESYLGARTNYIAKTYRGYDYNEFGPGTPEFKSAILPYGGQLYTNNAKQTTSNITNLLQFTKEFNRDHRINAMAGQEIRSNEETTIANTVWGYMPENGNLLAKPTPIKNLVPITGSYSSDWGVFDALYSDLNPSWSKNRNLTNFASYFATFAYSFKNRYVLNANIRNDMSNRFGQDVTKRFDPNYSFGLSWDVSREPWIENKLPFVDMMRIRGSYGIRGNALTNRSNELILRLGSLDNTYYDFLNRIYQLPNFNLSWEKTTDWNIGFDMGLFKGVNVVFDYYSKKSDVILPQDLPYEYGLGLNTMDINGGLINNRGAEISIEFMPINKKDLYLMVRVNSSKNFNKVGKAVTTATMYELLQGSSSKILREGYPVSGFWSFSYAGLSGVDGRPLFNNIDVPADQKSTFVDPLSFLVYSGESVPNFTGGLNINFRYKNLLFTSQFAALFGAKKRLSSPYSSFSGDGRMPAPEANLDRELLGRWKNPGDEAFTNIPAMIRGTDYRYELPNLIRYSWLDMWARSDMRVIDASFLRCRQLTLAWEFDEKFCKRIGATKLNVNASVANPFVIASSRLNGFDPELPGNQVMPRTYTLGLNVNF
ncbi:SusC/RagA family TonB-linked outer membrane protein [Pseudobacter ginsenosidimutans]|nr:SusC/RagA family TonB-linked outer membrane protein [Pseudobacter ginsenosidimutans]